MALCSLRVPKDRVLPQEHRRRVGQLGVAQPRVPHVLLPVKKLIPAVQEDGEVLVNHLVRAVVLGQPFFKVNLQGAVGNRLGERVGDQLTVRRHGAAD